MDMDGTMDGGERRQRAPRKAPRLDIPLHNCVQDFGRKHLNVETRTKTNTEEKYFWWPSQSWAGDRQRQQKSERTFKNPSANGKTEKPRKKQRAELQPIEELVYSLVIWSEKGHSSACNENRTCPRKKTRMCQSKIRIKHSEGLYPWLKEKPPPDNYAQAKRAIRKVRDWSVHPVHIIHIYIISLKWCQLIYNCLRPSYLRSIIIIFHCDQTCTNLWNIITYCTSYLE